MNTVVSVAMLKSFFPKSSVCLRGLLYVTLVSVVGCTNQPNKAPVVESVSTEKAAQCIGTPELPSGWAQRFEPVENSELLNASLGKADQGKLCQGKVYQSKPGSEVTLFRAWNSTNPNSRFGNWWALNKPSGNIAQYRKDYEICYQWSPLDQLIQCTLKPGTQVVVGNGQSAKCSKYLTYPTSKKLQVYIVNPAEALSHCTQYNGSISWGG